MSEITEKEAREAAFRLAHVAGDRSNDSAEETALAVYDTPDIEMAAERGRSDMLRVIDWVNQELSRRDAYQAARQQPITPEWCLANGARLSAEWCWFDDGVQLRPIAGGKWLVVVNSRMLDWSAECVGQVEDLRKALRGGV